MIWLLSFKENSYTCSMSTELRQMLEQVHKLSRAEQFALMASIAQFLSEEDVEQLPDAAFVQSILSQAPSITKGDKSLDPKALFGIWAGNPRNLQDIRKKAWKRDQS